MKLYGRTEWRVYEKLRNNRPKTQRGRVQRALLLIRKGWIDSQAFGDCFEMNDGKAVWAAVLVHICTKEPRLRQALIDQGLHPRRARCRSCPLRQTAGRIVRQARRHPALPQQLSLPGLWRQLGGRMGLRLRRSLSALRQALPAGRKRLHRLNKPIISTLFAQFTQIA